MGALPWSELLLLIGLPLVALFAVLKTWQIALKQEQQPVHQLDVQVRAKQLRDLDGCALTPGEILPEDVFFFIQLAPLPDGSSRWFLVSHHIFRQFEPGDQAHLTHKGRKVIQMKHLINPVRRHSAG